MFLLSCSNAKTPEALAMKTAQQSYAALAKGEYEEFLSARMGMDSIPDSYREQLIVGYKQFLNQQESNHGGIVEVEAMRAEADLQLQVMQVFLCLHFRDSTNEEIVVPMVEHNGQWKMK